MSAKEQIDDRKETDSNNNNQYYQKNEIEKSATIFKKEHGNIRGLPDDENLDEESDIESPNNINLVYERNVVRNDTKS